MRRKEKEIAEEADIEAVIRKARLCRLGLSDGEQPYIVPLCFGYDQRTLYFHSASEGKKLDIIRKNQRVCFELDVDTEVVRAEKACRWGMRYQSVIGFGKAVFVDSFEERQNAFAMIMRQYSPHFLDITDSDLKNITVIKVLIDRMTGKQS